MKKKQHNKEGVMASFKKTLGDNTDITGDVAANSIEITALSWKRDNHLMGTAFALRSKMQVQDEQL